MYTNENVKMDFLKLNVTMIIDEEILKTALYKFETI